MIFYNICLIQPSHKKKVCNSNTISLQKDSWGTLRFWYGNGMILILSGEASLGIHYMKNTTRPKSTAEATLLAASGMATSAEYMVLHIWWLLGAMGIMCSHLACSTKSMSTHRQVSSSNSHVIVASWYTNASVESAVGNGRVGWWYKHIAVASHKCIDKLVSLPARASMTPCEHWRCSSPEHLPVPRLACCLSDAGLRRWEQLSAWELCSDSSTKAAVAVHASAHVWHAKAGPENGVNELRHLQTTWDTCWRGEAQKPYTNYGTLALLSVLSTICCCRRKSIWQMGSICDGT